MMVHPPFAIAVFLLIRMVAAICPTGCTCNDEILTANCTGANLGVIPITLNPFLVRFTLRKNVVTQLKDQLYPYSDLSFLDFSDNEITELRPENFESVPKLEELMVARNRIHELNGRTFDQLRSLRVLDLSGNLISRINDDTFKSLSSLSVLDLSHNRLVSLQPKAFDELSSLRVLYLADNALTRVPTKVLQPLSALSELYLSYNGIDKLSDDSFTNKPNLLVLDLSGNGLISISDGSFSHLRKLKTLIMSDNALERIPSAALSLLPSLVELRFGRNLLEVISGNSLSGLSQLRLLDLTSSPRLRKILPGALRHVPQLQILFLNRTISLRHLEAGALFPAPALRVVSFNGGALSTVHREACEWDKLAMLDLSSIPLNCRCDLRWLLQAAKSSNGVLAVCDFPPSLRGRSICTLSERDLGCTFGRFASPEVVIVICTVLPLLFLTLAFVLVWFKFRRKIHLLIKQMRDQKDATRPVKSQACNAASAYYHNPYIFAAQYPYQYSCRDEPSSEV